MHAKANIHTIRWPTHYKFMKYVMQSTLKEMFITYKNLEYRRTLLRTTLLQFELRNGFVVVNSQLQHLPSKQKILCLNFGKRATFLYLLQLTIVFWNTTDYSEIQFTLSEIQMKKVQYIHSEFTVKWLMTTN